MPAGHQNVTDIPLSVFSGTNSELPPVDLPEGVSPDNQDVAFLPGNVFSRACTHKILNPALANSPTIMYEKSTLLPNGNPLTLLLDSNGLLYKEDPVNAPGVTVQIGQVAAGARAFSVTIDGVEYISFHDGAHGFDVPRQYNNGNLDRISQDGVGDVSAIMAIADVVTPVNITSVTLSNLASIAAAPNGATEVGNVVTITTTTPHGLFGPGVFVNIQGIPTAGYNGIYQVDQIISTTKFTVINAGSGLGADGTGTMGLALVTVVTAAAHGLSVGDAVVMAGNNGSFNNGAPTTAAGVETPLYWTVVQVINATTFVFGLSGPGGTLNTTTLTNGGASGTVTPGGLVSAGTHGVTVHFLTRNGYETKPAPTKVSWTCLGNRKAQITGLPIGPPDTVARIIDFTGAYGGNYFNIPTNQQIPGNSLLFNGTLAPPTIVQSTWVLDNATTTVTVNFPDNTLFNGIGIDQPGNNLFAQCVLAPCLGMHFYASRLWAWGELNKVQKFQNMGFEGGIQSGVMTTPLGWTPVGTAGTLVNAPNGFGWAWQITGDGVAHTQGGLQQSAYQNELFQQILSPNTAYTMWVWAKASAPALAGLLEFQLSAASTGFSSIAFVACNTISTTGKFIQINFPQNTPSVIPPDMVLTVFGFNITNGATIVVDEQMMVFTAQPFRDSFFRISYVNNFEAFDLVTGELGPTEDAAPLRCASTLRGEMVFQTAERMHRTSDNGTSEPNGWIVNEVAMVGAMSVNSMSPVAKGEEWFFTLSGGTSGLGVYIYDGSGPYKVSQEYQTWFDGINQAAKSTAWLVNDPVIRRVYCSIPSSSSAFPNLLTVMDYRELDQPGQIGGSPPIHISFTGKMIASDLVRKWTRWNLTLNCGTILYRGNGVTQFVVGAGNGQAPGGAAGFGNLYYFDPNKLTDDDFGQMSPYYWTYGFVNHEMEQQMQLGSHRHNYTYLTTRCIGVGNLVVSPAINELTNIQRALRAQQLTSTLTRDIERPLAGTGFSLKGERCFFKFAVMPLNGQTDVKFNLQKVVVTVREDELIPVAGPR